VSIVDPCDPVEAYVRPIRSVLFIDDQFPTYGQPEPNEASEAERARALWQACTERGWLCDIANSADWSSQQRKRRLASCDLLVLDYHLADNDSRPALAIIRDLARSETPNLVVIYTADPKTDRVLMAAAASARGVSAEALETELNPAIEEIEIEWTQDDILAFIGGRHHWMKTYSAACKSAGVPAVRSSGEVLMEKWIAKNFGVPPQKHLLSIEAIKCSENLWFQCGNLFSVIIGKPSQQVFEEEALIVLTGLEAAVKDWAPSWLACLVASSRRSAETGAFRDDVNLPADPLQVGLLRYIGESQEGEERARRAREVSSHLLTRRFDHAAGSMSEQLLHRAVTAAGESAPADDDKAQLLHLNAFLCSEDFTRHHLRVGTIFRAKDGDDYWVCVTPGCDMVPRKPLASLNPWAANLDPVRPLMALALELRRGKEITESLERAERGRHLFFWDSGRQPTKLIVAACFSITTDDPNPRLEQMFAVDRARVHDKRVLLQRCVRDQQSNMVVIKNLECEVVCQLRAPYAERLAHIAGHHLSRIGVNFFRLADPASDA
jgi:CheY-like chemotaxis protein